jgi:hypothetical protein
MLYLVKRIFLTLLLKENIQTLIQNVCNITFTTPAGRGHGQGEGS